MPYAGWGNDDDDDREDYGDDYGYGPMGGHGGGGAYGWGDDDDYFPPYGNPYNVYGNFPMIGHHNVYQYWPPMPPPRGKSLSLL